MHAYTKYFDKNSKYMNVLVNDKEILQKYSEIWNKIKILIKKEVNQCLMINTLKLKNYNDKVYTNFRHNKIHKGNAYCVCLSVISLDFIFVNSNKIILFANAFRRMQIYN